MNRAAALIVAPLLAQLSTASLAASPHPLSAAAPARQAAPQQPVIPADAGPVLTLGQQRFRDLNRNGRLDPYEDWRLPVARRVADLVGRMTLAEKAGAMMHGSLVTPDSAVGASSQGYDRAAAQQAIAGQHITSFITRLAVSPERMAQENNAIQVLAAQTRLGIPLTISTDPRHHFQVTVGASAATQGYSQWPETLGFAALGDAALMRHFGDVARREYRATGIHMALSPQADLFTDPRWPRGTGTFGANADLARAMVEAYVIGFQGNAHMLARDGVATVVKHWVGYGANPQGFDGHNYYGRMAVHDDATLKTHIRPFLGAFAAGVAGVMPTYDIISGPHVAGKPLEPVAAGYNAQLLGMLRKDYGFKGLILSDWGITRDCSQACRAPTAPQTPNEIAMPWGVEDLTPAQRYAKATRAGIDQFGGVTEPERVIRDVQAGTIPIARVNAAVARIMTLKFVMGLFDNPLVDPAAARDAVTPAALAEGRKAQAQAQVLLRNEGAILPLAAGTRVYLKGIDAAQARAHGLVVVERPQDAQVALMRATTPFERLHPNNFFGSRQNEGRLDFRPGNADYDAVAQVAATVPVVLAVFLDRPAILTEILPKTRAVLGNFGVSDEGLLDVVTGKETARGRLPFELPRTMAAVERQNPAVGDDSVDPLFPFGFGLGVAPAAAGQ
ncbi:MULTISPECIES: glycoside hydrolase family 3 protein [unclassified Novosphingobium]|uniref:glycoside hydrolase family 3 protein n=1 Tax=unclassified Novosphingobium TaxID=2644732 RepID=UPI001494D7E8|nr:MULTISPECIES: glycoside hydrolase family 3 N-terminal domain-containing protein [unclassified Novosphingobium]MBB3357985.1 beta-glucosidase [Novosphingobium sp. BK256]MBB3374346.1 beta-glucosidase [Novosphingobium sp. BK280]MBB3378758.1 beta-glucosidase [Novosphingobium sp. BK258]MBB3420452.1 beta-glucosidase [Novosphingobium sp. BK267]MBB3448426.1 beta-glucosidase [Novosphingobium sp. BK352]